MSIYIIQCIVNELIILKRINLVLNWYYNIHVISMQTILKLTCIGALRFSSSAYRQSKSHGACNLMNLKIVLERSSTSSSISTPLACKLAMNFCRHKLNLCFFFSLQSKNQFQCCDIENVLCFCCAHGNSMKCV